MLELDTTILLANHGELRRKEFRSSVTVTTAGQVAVLEFNRPNKRNALNMALIYANIEAATWLNENPEIKVVAITGRGPSFCAGFDLSIVEDEDDISAVTEAVDALRRMIDALESINAVTVALIHGDCVGGGLLIALASDLRIAASDARLWLPEVELGIPLACGGVPRLAREIGAAQATEMILLAGEVAPTRAHALGVLNEVVNEAGLQERADQILTTLAERPTILLRTTKQQVTAAVRSNTQYAFTDAHLAHAALIDPEARKAREQYLATLGRGPS